MRYGALIGRGPKRRCEIGDGARLLRVVHEVTLGEAVGLLADDLDGVLVRADRAVGAEPEEDRPQRVRRLDIEAVVHLQRQAVTSSTMPTVKWRFGVGCGSSSNTAFAIAGENSFEPSP